MMVHGLTPARKAPGAQSSSNTQGASAPNVSRPTAPFLIGHGYDIHRLESRGDGKLVLAGVTVSSGIAPIAHSDGDVVYHALCDAMLGALGLGDIGESFPDSDPRWQDAASHVFVEDVVSRVRRDGYRVSNIDVTLMLERPKIAPYKPQMMANLRQLLEPVDVVNLKAGTNEGCDSIGRGEAVAAHVVVLLARQS
jgi:2-C-methyl-D-erythritol 2,4-cyclodiphosphate synthase